MRRNLIAMLLLVFSSGCASQRHSAKGWSYLKEKNNTEAISEFQNALAVNPLPGSYAGLWRAYMNLGDYSKAKSYLDEGLSKFPNDKFLRFAEYEYVKETGQGARTVP